MNRSSFGLMVKSNTVAAARSLGVLTVATLVLAVAACNSSHAPSPRPAATADEANSVEAAQQAPATACELVTQAEMSRILGAPVVAQNNDHSTGKTECIYTAASGISPYAELSIDWGGGEGAMMGVSMLGQHEPGIANPYEGLGDQAAAIGPALMIRTGEDLVTLVFSGVEDIPSKAKQIFETAKARM
jgi:hypothetical protein